MKIWKILLVLFLTLGMATIGNAAAYMKFGDIKGESTDKEHKDWIIIESVSSPLFRAEANIDPTGQCKLDLPPGPTLGDVVVVKEFDRSSVKLQESVCNGTFYEEVIIDFVSTKRRGGRTFLRYKLKDVIITSYSAEPGTNCAGEPVPVEELSLNFGDIEFEYVPEKKE